MLRRHKSVPTKKLAPRHIPASSVRFHAPDELAVAAQCGCCGHRLYYPKHHTKVRCVACATTTQFEPHPDDGEPMSYTEIKRRADEALAAVGPAKAGVHRAFEPLLQYLAQGFASYAVLNRLFLVNPKSRSPHYSTSNLDYREIGAVYHLLVRLPTKLPLYRALSAGVELLKHLGPHDWDDPRSFLWVLVLLENPFLNRALVLDANPDLRHMANTPEIKALCHEILKRGLGILANSVTARSTNYVSSWLARVPPDAFSTKVDLVNHYITFHLKTFYQLAQTPARRRLVGTPDDYTDHVALKRQSEGTVADDASVVTTASKQFKRPATRISVNQYGNSWHIRAAAAVMGMLVKANTIRAPRVPVSTFYNSLVDYVDLRADFDAYVRKTAPLPLDQLDMWSPRAAGDSARVLFCQHPYLVSLGGKMTVLGYEARRQMERRAEQAFITALDQHTKVDVNFRIAVRRDHIIDDSMSAIKHNPDNLKKTLRVSFVDEPGIDAGGLKKEWFLLLTRQLFRPSTGLFVDTDSHQLWFIPHGGHDDVYYLLGAVLGLAVYNSTILDHQFPLAFYKVLLGQRVTEKDYADIFPDTVRHLEALRTMLPHELEALDLDFSISYQDPTGKPRTQADARRVTAESLGAYISHYATFFVRDAIAPAVRALHRGFQQVCGGNALNLFLPEEIRFVLCGSVDRIDVDTLKAITRYNGWGKKEVAEQSPLIEWFWRYLRRLPESQQRKFLHFVTGSDRVPATGIQNMSFKIALAGDDHRRLPTAHTCFNELELYSYRSYDELAAKLDQAVNDSAGFGIK